MSTQPITNENSIQMAPRNLEILDTPPGPIERMIGIAIIALSGSIFIAIVWLVVHWLFVVTRHIEHVPHQIFIG